MNGLQAEWGDRVPVVQVNVLKKENQPLVEAFGGQFTPTFVLVDQNGQEAWRMVGRIDPAEAQRQAEQLLNEISPQAQRGDRPGRPENSTQEEQAG